MAVQCWQERPQPDQENVCLLHLSLCMHGGWDMALDEATHVCVWYWECLWGCCVTLKLRHVEPRPYSSSIQKTPTRCVGTRAVHQEIVTCAYLIFNLCLQLYQKWCWLLSKVLSERRIAFPRICMMCLLLQMELITQQAMRAGFMGGVLVDYPNSTKAKKYVRCSGKETLLLSMLLKTSTHTLHYPSVCCGRC